MKSNRLLVSHAVPPQTRLTAKPCCLYTRSRAEGIARNTYAPVETELGGWKSSIVCYVETISTSQIPSSQEADAVEKYEHELGSQEDPIVFLDAFSANEGVYQPPAIITVRKHGEISCLSGNLKNIIWTSGSRLTGYDAGLPNPKAPQLAQVDFVMLSDARRAAAGLFHDRPDVLTMLQPNSHRDSQDTQSKMILYLVIKYISGDTSRRVLVALLVSPTSQIPASPIQHLTQWEIPLDITAHMADVQKSTFEYGLDIKSGIFQQMSKESLCIMQITGPTPKIISILNNPSAPTTSFLQISSSSILQASKSYLSLWSTDYGSLQCVQTTGIEDREPRTKKKKRALLDVSAFRLLSFFEDLQLVVALSGNDLVAFQVLPHEVSNKRRKVTGSRLIDAFDKSMSTGITFPTIQKLEKISLRESPTAFETAFFTNLHSRHVLKTFNHLSARLGPSERPFGMLFEPELSMNVRQYTNTEVQDIRGCALYMLSRCMEWFKHSKSGFVTPLNPSSIFIKRMPSRILCWLIINNQFTASNIEVALRASSDIDMKTRKVAAQDVVTALSFYDPSLVLLAGFFAQSNHLDLPGTVKSLGLFLRSFDTPQSIDEGKLLSYTSDVQAANGTTVQTGETLDDDFAGVERAATKDIAIATSVLENGLQIRGNALSHVAQRLASCFARSEVTVALQTHLAEHDITLLIELLRVELVNGGWTSHSLDWYPTEDGAVARSDAITAISTLLNSALDALGTGGWLAGTSDVGAETLISTLRNEASLVLEGVQESSFFSGFLGDFFRYETMLKQAKRDTKRAQGQVARDPHINVPAAQMVKSILPLGVRKEKVLDTRVAAGGEIRARSARDVGNELSQRLGKYTFETIRI